MRRTLVVIALLPIAYYLLCIAGLVYLRHLPPPTTTVQIQRTVEQLVSSQHPVRDYRWRSKAQISPHLPRAVVAAEDARFFQHRGFDWQEVREARNRAQATDLPMRGASTLTHQLIKNLFFTTHRNPVRKVYEWALTPPAEWILGKNRILELYVNVVEFGPGIYGAESAARYHYGIPAADLSRYQAMRLAAILPAPLVRRPQAMDGYAGIIEQRMSQLGW
ncbi:monofunctional biosynthetic peptidoglycan transglycosylase [Thioalkalivibrio denitrificans]|uniref:Biosynthetic peptidoglycan transglycosylase n=1 Tax=Thioalkalivibrio denitrificans TaxID=108003 RepID=A0A1V3NDZ8_9GAMM|nr:monofunctional biosynthetic peptidoglycan transglycosylase [Thioalkalivibrio denitrificans]